jgi:hypothetical protein
MIWIVLVLLAMAIGGGWAAFDRQQKLYEQMFGLLLRERDQARNESTVYRNLLFPVLRDTKSDPAPTSNALHETRRGASERGPVAAPTAPAGPSNFLGRRIPFKIRFKTAMRTLNTKQQKTDALASALENQKPQEKQNVSA